ncbi:MAG: LPXTG cell wall anchor domain-containing protein [Dehalococcoidia bacterium]|nr:LPXTG cell wall anchor domain-containing protein [Dehalococcoidia bacterium]
MTATAEADAAATAQAMADNMTATAVAEANATAQARADATATAQAKITPSPTPDPDAPPPPPTATPRASATPVHTEMAAVTAVEGATTVEPDMSVSLMAGNVTVKLPTLSRARTYQAMLSESDECGSMAAACAMVSIYNAEGEMESDVRLISSAEIEVTLDAATVDALGGDLDGAAVAIQASALGGIMLQLMDDESGTWNSIPSTFVVNSDGSATVSGMTRRFSHIALMVYDDVVEQARMQVSMALGTPTATPVPPTATPAPPTATPVPPTPTPEPEPEILPDTGDSSVPFLLLLAMAIFASMAALVGTKVIMARVRR